MSQLHDHNGWLGTWPFRDLNGGGTPGHLNEVMDECGITSAWVSPLEALFRTESESANEALALTLKEYPQWQLVPVFVPLHHHTPACLARWGEGARRLPALRLAPGFHAYKLGDGSCLEFVEEALRNHWKIAVTVRLLDERSQSRAFPVASVPLGELIALAERFPAGWFLGCGVRAVEIKAEKDRLRQTPNLRFDISHVDNGFGLEDVVELLGAERFVFGTQYPVLYPHAAVKKRELLLSRTGERLQ